MASDPDTDEFREKLAHMRRHGIGVMRSGASASTRERPVLHEHTGERVGFHTDHWDGRVDATAEKVVLQATPALTAMLNKETPSG